MITGAYACQSHSQLLSLEQQLGLEWGNALREEFALAPKAAVKDITPQIYDAESSAIGEFSFKNAFPIMEKYSCRSSFKGSNRIQWAGAGLLRERRLLFEGAKIGFNFTFREVSAFACENVRIVANVNGIPSHAVTVVPGDFLTHWEPYGDTRESGIFYAGQFIQLFTPEEARKVMNVLGAFLHNPKGARTCDRRICLVHPLPEDNVGAVWKHSFLHSNDDLIRWAGKGNGPIKAEVKGKHNYYGGPPRGHVYSFVVLSAG